MFCPICGVELNENEQTCPICGYEMESEKGKQVEQIIQEETICFNCGCPVSAEESVCPICGNRVVHPNPTIQSNEVVVEKELEAQQEESEEAPKHPYLPIIILIISILIVGAAFFLILNTGKDSEQDTTNTTENVDNKENKNKTVEVKGYIGYWNIEGDTNKELIIHSGEENKVAFSLWYRNSVTVENIVVQLEGNAANFSTIVNSQVIKGKITFEEGHIILKITKSENPSISKEVMEFKERHTYSWRYSSSTYQYEYSKNNTVGQGEYILPDSSSRLLTDADLVLLSAEQLKLARNEIYARHGRKFLDAGLMSYFQSKSWYNGHIEPENFTDDMLSSIEKQNIQLIKSHE